MSHSGTLSSSGEVDSRDDSELVLAVNCGDIGAFAVLYQRYASKARRAAARWSASPAERDDIVSESFGRLFASLRSGGGPRGDFPPYLFRVIHNVAVDQTRQERLAEPREDLDSVEGPSLSPDPVILAWQREVLAKAFGSLSPRWQQVLWLVQVEGLRPATVAQALGISPNAVAALAYRAREGLRLAYLQLHVQNGGDDACELMVRQLVTWVRRGLPDRGSAEVSDHLRGCADCRERAATLDELNRELAGARSGPAPS